MYSAKITRAKTYLKTKVQILTFGKPTWLTKGEGKKRRIGLLLPHMIKSMNQLCGKRHFFHASPGICRNTGPHTATCKCVCTPALLVAGICSCVLYQEEPMLNS